ncbi:hypothetical protein AAHZ94_32560, partial [Streptomyces sp. HSW2009]
MSDATERPDAADGATGPATESGRAGAEGADRPAAGRGGGPARGGRWGINISEPPSRAAGGVGGVGG